MVYEQLHVDNTMLHSLLARVFWLDAKLGARCLQRGAFSDINLLPVGGQHRHAERTGPAGSRRRGYERVCRSEDGGA